jgi:hypothetical protein
MFAGVSNLASQAIAASNAAMTSFNLSLGIHLCIASEKALLKSPNLDSNSSNESFSVKSARNFCSLDLLISSSSTLSALRC